ncbi:UNVERIFIED_ORG: hypothetical protein OKW16_002467 [Pseudomonas reinekei]|nr:hypothetical protein [Pseudomonas reinekei]
MVSLARSTSIIAFGQAHRGILALGIEYRVAVVGTLLTLAVLGHLLFVEQRLAQAHVGALRVVVQIPLDAALALGTVDLVVVGRGIDLRQQAGLADGAVFAAGFFFMHGGLVDRALVLQQVPGLLEVHGVSRQGQPQQAEEQAMTFHFIVP